MHELLGITLYTGIEARKFINRGTQTREINLEPDKHAYKSQIDPPHYIST
jgi:hypothetical protein